MTIWLISDTHFGQANMYTLVDKQGQRVRGRFENVQQGDAYMAQMWADRVKPQDHVYHLGDVAMRREGLAVVKTLPGHKRLIYGNHDILSLAAYRDAGFQKFFGSRRISGLLLTHIPVHNDSLGEKILANIHGHTHEKAPFTYRHVNVSVEQTDYAPITLEQAYQRALIQKEKRCDLCSGKGWLGVDCYECNGCTMDIYGHSQKAQ